MCIDKFLSNSIEEKKESKENVSFIYIFLQLFAHYENEVQNALMVIEANEVTTDGKHGKRKEEDKFQYFVLDTIHSYFDSVFFLLNQTPNI